MSDLEGRLFEILGKCPDLCHMWSLTWYPDAVGLYHDRSCRMPNEVNLTLGGSKYVTWLKNHSSILILPRILITIGKLLWLDVRQLINSMMTSSNGNIFRVTGHLCGEFTGPRWIPGQRPVTRSFDVFFDLRLNKRLNKQSWGWWFETLSRPLWRHCNVLKAYASVAQWWSIFNYTTENNNQVNLIQDKITELWLDGVLI